MYGREKRFGDPNWKRRLGYSLLGELHIPGRLRAWHVIKTLRSLGYWRDMPSALLDAGGGKGAFAYYFARRFPQWQVVVADDDREALARGRKIQTALRLERLALREVDLNTIEDCAVFDVAICADVLEHIEEDAMVVRNLARALKPGGVVVVTSPSVPQPWHLPLVRWREKRIGFDPSDYGHVRDGYCAADLRRLFSEAGLETRTIRQTFGRPGTLMFDLFFATGDSSPNPVIYLLLFPLYMALAGLDSILSTECGAAILAVGVKPRE